MPEHFHYAVMTFSCVLQKGENLTSERVINETGAQVVASLHFWYELFRQRGDDNFIMDSVRDTWEEYKKYQESQKGKGKTHSYATDSELPPVALFAAGGAEDGRGRPGRALGAQQPRDIVSEGRGCVRMKSAALRML